MKDIRLIFENHVATVIKSNKVAVLLSSGLDGLVAGLSAHAIGKKVHAFTFQMGDNVSFDSKHAAIVADKLGWASSVIKVPTDLDSLKKAWCFMHGNLDCRKKRDYECTYPMLYALTAIKKAKFRYVLTGFAADAYFCFARNTHIAQISGPQSTKKAFDQYRAEYWAPWFEHGTAGLNSEYNPSALYQIEQLCKAHKLIHVNPWLLKDSYDFFMQFSWQELNMPKQKRHVVEAWKEYIDIVGHRPHRGYQTEAKVPMYFEQLLEDEEINFLGRKRIMDVARDWDKYRREVA